MTHARPVTEERGADVRFPPPLVFLVSTLLGVALQIAVGAIPLLTGGWPLCVAGALLMLGAFFLGFAARQVMVRSGQNPRPWLPAPSLLTSGPFRFVRNPMYTGLTVVQIGIGLVSANLWICLLAPVSLLIVHVIAVLPEEAYLTAKFGESYTAYLAKVGRYVPRFRPHARVRGPGHRPRREAGE